MDREYQDSLGLILDRINDCQGEIMRIEAEARDLSRTKLKLVCSKIGRLQTEIEQMKEDFVRLRWQQQKQFIDLEDHIENTSHELNRVLMTAVAKFKDSRSNSAVIFSEPVNDGIGSSRDR
ncbi:MAG: hypothetical protein GF404_09110 [candidate division Zixibacteria bacterium]|nr:hypothetical protein [candidate division Zixibacteria bacterium]